MKSSDGLNWGKEITVHYGDRSWYDWGNPRVVSNGNGTLMFGYGFEGGIVAPRSGNYREVGVARSADYGNSWDLIPVSLANDHSSADTPRMAFDGSKGWLIAWTQFFWDGINLRKYLCPSFLYSS
jgi:hypothetical protein